MTRRRASRQALGYGLRNGYDSLRDRHESSIGGAPIGFVKSGPDEYRSRDDLWKITHKYKSGINAHHEWYVYGPDGHLWTRYRGGAIYYRKLSDAVEAINEAVAGGVIGMLRNLFERLAEQDAARAKREREAMEHAAKVGNIYTRIEAWLLVNGTDALTASAGRRGLAEFLAQPWTTPPTLGELLRANTDEDGNIGPIPVGEIARSR